MLNWRAIEPFGCVVDLDISQPLAPEQERELRKLLWDRQVLIFKGQCLTHERQADIIEVFAPVWRNKEGMHFVTTEEDDPGGLGRGELTFHSDCAFMDKPRTVLSLHALDVVDGETSTKWASARNCLESLPARLRQRLETAKVLNVMPSEYTDRFSTSAVPDWLPHHWHDALIRHPHTGERLPYIMEMQSAGIDGASAADGDEIIRATLDCFYRPEATLEHVWHNGDFVIWDNISTQHARGSLDGKGRRVLQKVQAGGTSLFEWPFFDTPEVQNLLNATSTVEKL